MPAPICFPVYLHTCCPILRCVLVAPVLEDIDAHERHLALLAWRVGGREQVPPIAQVQNDIHATVNTFMAPANTTLSASTTYWLRPTLCA